MVATTAAVYAILAADSEKKVRWEGREGRRERGREGGKGGEEEGGGGRREGERMKKGEKEEILPVDWPLIIIFPYKC